MANAELPHIILCWELSCQDFLLFVLDFQTVWICCLDVLKLPPGPLGPPACSGDPFLCSQHQDTSRSAELREKMNSKGTGLSLGMSVLVHGRQKITWILL